MPRGLSVFLGLSVKVTAASAAAAAPEVLAGASGGASVAAVIRGGPLRAERHEVELVIDRDHRAAVVERITLAGPHPPPTSPSKSSPLGDSSSTRASGMRDTAVCATSQ